MKTKIMIWIVNKLPKTLIYYCASHLGAYVSTHEFANKEVPKIRMMEALKSYADHFNCY